MSHLLRPPASHLMFTFFTLGAFAVAAGCTDDSDPLPVGDEAPIVAAPDSGHPRTIDGGNDNNQPPPHVDSGTDANQDGSDACADGGCAPPPAGCALYADAAFCADFDGNDPLHPSKWDFLESTAIQPVLGISTDRAVSAPKSLLTRVIDKDTPGAKFAKAITKDGFTEATWSYDVYFDSIGPTDGFFLDDFQFTDDGGPDRFGFRLVIFADNSALKSVRVEHNGDVIGAQYAEEPDLPAGTIMLGKWHHFEQRVKFTFGTDNKVQYTLTVDKSQTPVFQKYYEAPSREGVDFARVAGMPLIFNKEHSAGLKIYWDNSVLEMK